MGQCLSHEDAVSGAPAHVANLKKAPQALPPNVEFGYKRNFEAHYVRGKELGRGQFGVTYAARNLETQEQVAVKMILKKTLITPVDVEDTKREVQILSLLRGHENVVQYIDAFEDGERVFIVMELCEGGELLDRILAKRGRHYSEKDAAMVVRQMLNVVARCHLFGVVHRDLKPENFLFKSKAEDAPLKAVDFGLSEFYKPGKKFSNVVGSAYYVAPEVLKRRSGPEADVWSVGVITYILLCGRRPFWDRTEDGIFKEVLKGKPDFRDHPWPQVSPLAVQFVKKLLKKDPKARLTAAQAHSHPWVRVNGKASDIPLDISVLSNLRSFVRYSRLKQLAMRALATTLEDDELVDLKDQFEAIDLEQRGTITLEELKKVLVKNKPYKILQRKDSTLLDRLTGLDTDKNGVIDFREFVSAAMHVHQLEEADAKAFERRVRKAFEYLDKDRNGYLEPEEIRKELGIKGSVDDIFEEGDLDADGKISYAEFKNIVETISATEGNWSSLRRPSIKAE
eukprot:TRINITY_DN104_c0_g1_i1.p1 TRINITY_DN104_c0_g1~~TRINITY_DN104_c0_g1_i1.p1  ORF type:complete len:510 (+),score=159.60 TRINITY_DN104_c0_g1_i1:723-2252(+)